MNIKTKLTETDFINVSFVLLYDKLSTKILTGIGVLLLVFNVSAMIYEKQSSLSQLLSPAILLVFLPLVTYFTAKRNYAANKRISENIEYIFGEESLDIKGESFNTQLTWDKIYKVTQSTNWILIWHTSQSANPLPKRDVWDEQRELLKNILDSHKVKNKL